MSANQSAPGGLDFDKRPILVFWESTKACLLSCRHCRAEAIRDPLPTELSTASARHFIESLMGFGKPYPVLIITGGDVLMRGDIEALLRYAREIGVPVAVSPSATPLLTPKKAQEMKALGVKIVSISLDGARPETHEGIRGVRGHFWKTLDAIELLASEGFTVQVNTTVMKENAYELADIASIVHSFGAGVWEVFFLIQVGRGRRVGELDPHECKAVTHFLYDASRYGFIVRTVEGPFFRRVAAELRESDTRPNHSLYINLSNRLKTLMGPPSSAVKAQTKGTRDGKGIIFVSHDGRVYPSGFLPVTLGNVLDTNIVEIYRESPLLQKIRAAEFEGRCRSCGFSDSCGGSRARAYAATGDPLGEDPACPY